MGKLAHLHNNKCRFEPIESLLTFKWYKDVISKVCAYPGWLFAWMCREWSNSHASACALRSSVQHWQPCWQCLVIGEKREVEKVARGSVYVCVCRGSGGIEEHTDLDGIGKKQREVMIWGKVELRGRKVEGRARTLMVKERKQSSITFMDHRKVRSSANISLDIGDVRTTSCYR